MNIKKEREREKVGGASRIKKEIEKDVIKFSGVSGYKLNSWDKPTQRSRTVSPSYEERSAREERKESNILNLPTSLSKHINI